MEFDVVLLTKNPVFQFGVRAGVVPTTAVLLGLDIAIFAIGKAAASTTVLFAVVIVILAPVSAWHMSRYVPRKVTIDGIGVHVRGGSVSGSYFWSDIVSMRTTTFTASQRRTAAVARLLGINGTVPVLEVTLRKMPRLSLLGSRFGTDVTLGAPIPMRRIVLYLRQPQECVDYCSSHFAIRPS